MRNTPPDPHIQDKDSNRLLEDLCTALRNVGVWESDLPDGDDVKSYIDEVKMIHAELERRGVNSDSRIAQLSKETEWQTEGLLRNCLDFPKTMPYVRDTNGILRRLRCWLCLQDEHPVDDERFFMCDKCLQQLMSEIRRKIPSKRVVLYRTYNEDKRCHHANSDTVLAGIDWGEDGLGGFCEQCILEELERRKTAGTT